ncbi:hypothetical protein PHMEG_0003381 [Phytophthora megakarya]|uniref:Chromo domain-containing protein n=1 Tax=Phytophthora megakarya TaxID=4795 RepID=A0A225WW76_9STRA|nr:hypothetical protein PHMEG_0003381 [Phytophthora megakarya]
MKMDILESDVTGRVVDNFKGFQIIVADNGLTGCFRHESGARHKCKRLITSLQPPALKPEVKQCIRYTHADAEKDPMALFTLDVEKVTELERQFIRLTLQKPGASGREEKPKALRMFKAKQKQQAPPTATFVEVTKKAKLKGLGELLPTTGRTGVLNGVLELPYSPDKRSDFPNETLGERKLTATLKAKLHVQIHTAAGSMELIELMDMVDVNDGEFILVDWKGLQSIEDSYEPIGDLVKEIRVLVDNYVANADDQQPRELWQLLRGDQVCGMGHDVQQNADSEIVSSTGAMRGPQGDAKR